MPHFQAIDNFSRIAEFVSSKVRPLPATGIVLCDRGKAKAGVSLSSIRVLVVEDSEPFRRFITAMLKEGPDLQVICDVLDGLEAVQKAKELRPDLILLDIGLPNLNGIEAARRIRSVSPKSKIIFVSQESSPDIVQSAFSFGACGYVVKTDAGTELLAAVNAALRGERFVGARFAGHDFTEASDSPEHPVRRHDTPASALTPLRGGDSVRRHEVLFHSDDTWLLDNATQFIATALKAGNASIVVATESHRNGILPRLQAYGVDIGAAIEQGGYMSLDAADAVSRFMVNGRLESVRLWETFGNLIPRAAKVAGGEHPRVSLFGEGADLIWKQGNAEAAIQDEKLCNQLTKRYDVDILCAYSLGGFQRGTENNMYHKICAEHSSVHSQ